MMSCHLTHDEAVVDTVKRELSKYEIVHLACHGIQDSINPLDSAFALNVGNLKLQDLMRLSLEKAELAVLFVCQTATGDENLPEEAVHLAAGMLAVGYPSVVATMWSISDRDAPIVADKVYENLLGHRDELETRNPSQSAAYEHLRKEVGTAYALHAAVKYLRSPWGHHDKLVTRNPRQSAAYALHAAVEHLRKEVGEMEFVKWIPFVHYGV
ncbi:hypothetical protein D9758_013491 [Tetrapyrgos nigripes]|uniref:CHAT domain-containing protein n=1 Tax=Tetrapyrgos nigripes TaxID=182062 RepID=A0A8H5CSH9_9AGAR|nr:hypothetical protein D9758_013491 [Tetrapyrgos nigripes]